MKTFLLALSVLLAGCTASLPQGDTTENALSWGGVYEGTLPCADCEGIKTTVSLFYDNAFIVKSVYEKTGDNYSTVEKGKFTWDKQNNTIIHLPLSNNEQFNFFVGEGRLEFYDQNSQPIKSNLNYTLEQIEVFE